MLDAFYSPLLPVVISLINAYRFVCFSGRSILGLAWKFNRQRAQIYDANLLFLSFMISYHDR